MTRKILLLDNRDSFVHNLARYFRLLNCDTTVVRSDAVTISQIVAEKPDVVVISPGPCTPDEAGCSLTVVEELSGKFPLLGVCLGHQVIGQAMGGKIVRNEPVHGVASLVYHSGQGLFDGLQNPLQVGRYHSLTIDAETVPSRIEILAETAEKEIMAIADRNTLTWGVQFHPESILTQQGDKLLSNFLRLAFQ
jgi:anthranilate synthase/aminodeoxychorismate synthase-like glutamine amidotransferase